jgi:hypothetical protein
VLTELLSSERDEIYNFRIKYFVFNVGVNRFMSFII